MALKRKHIFLNLQNQKEKENIFLKSWRGANVGRRSYDSMLKRPKMAREGFPRTERCVFSMAFLLGNGSTNPMDRIGHMHRLNQMKG